MTKNIRPLHDRVLVEVIEKEHKTEAGVYLPIDTQEKSQTAKVIAAGPGKFAPSGDRVPMSVKTGDLVFFGKYAGTEAGHNLLIIKEEEILGIVEQ